MTFGENLIRYRKDKGMTQEELAEKLDVSRQSVSKWENGDSMPDADKLIRLSDLLDASLDELTGRQVKLEPIVVPAPEVPAAPEPRPKKKLRSLLAALLAAALFIGGWLLPSPLTKNVPAEKVCVLPETLTAEGLSFGMNDGSGVTSLRFLANCSGGEGRGTLYPELEGLPAMEGNAVCENGVWTAEFRAMANMTYKTLHFTARDENGNEKSVLLAERLVFDRDGGLESWISTR